MKNKFLFLAIFLFVGFAYAQNYSQKYNDLYKRTEFYNSNGDAVAGINSISNMYIFTNFSTPVFVKIINIATNCAFIKPLNYNFYSPI